MLNPNSDFLNVYETRNVRDAFLLALSRATDGSSRYTSDNDVIELNADIANLSTAERQALVNDLLVIDEQVAIVAPAWNLLTQTDGGELSLLVLELYSARAQLSANERQVLLTAAEKYGRGEALLTSELDLLFEAVGRVSLSRSLPLGPISAN